MLEAAGWGLVAGSSLLLGALLGTLLPIPERVIGLLLGFGAGTLISALAFELTDEAFRLGGADAVAIGLALGAVAYYAGDVAISSRGGGGRMSPRADRRGGAGAALLLGAVLDGIPESAVIGITLLEGGTVGVPVLAAVFISNLPESVSSSKAMRDSGSDRGHIFAVWVLVTAVCAASAALGFGLLDGASGNTVGVIQAFAGGAVLTMLADTMMPEAFDHGGRAAGLFTVLGFALAYLLTTIE